MAQVLDKWKAFDQGVKSAEVAVLRKKIKRFNVITGILLALVTGVLGGVMTVISVDVLTSPLSVLSRMCICVYTAFFGALILMFELSNSPKVNKYFRENYGFFMNFNGRAIFLLSVGFFAMGAGGSGVLSGLVAMFDAIFHLYVVRANPQMKIAIREA